MVDINRLEFDEDGELGTQDVVAASDLLIRTIQYNNLDMGVALSALLRSYKTGSIAVINASKEDGGTEAAKYNHQMLVEAVENCLREVKSIEV